MALLVFYLSLALGFSFLCSLLEASMLSVTVGHVSARAAKGAAGARLMKSYKERPDRPLAAILSANTVAHTVGAAGVGAQVVAVWGDRWLGVASGVLTILILFFTEIVPKTLGTIHANRLVPFTAFTIRAMVVVLYPLVVAAELASRFVTGRDVRVPISREEVAAIADLGKRGGSLSAGEAATIRNLLSLRSIQVSDIMTPRTVVEHVPDDMTVGEFAASNRESLFARMPVTRGGNVDDVVGMIHRVMILDAIRKDETGKTFREMMRPIGAIPETVNSSWHSPRWCSRRNTCCWWSTSTAARREWSPSKTSWRPCWGSRSSTRPTRPSTCASSRESSNPSA